MNLEDEDMDISEYYEKKETKRNELADCYAIMFVITLSICCFCVAYELVKWIAK